MFDRFKSIDPFFAFLDSIEKGQIEDTVVLVMKDGTIKSYTIRPKDEIEKPSLKIVLNVTGS